VCQDQEFESVLTEFVLVQRSLSDHAEGLSHGTVDNTYVSKCFVNSMNDSIAPGISSMRAKIPSISFLSFSSRTFFGNLGNADSK